MANFNRHLKKADQHLVDSETKRGTKKGSGWLACWRRSNAERSSRKKIVIVIELQKVKLLRAAGTNTAKLVLSVTNGAVNVGHAFDV